MTLTHPARSVRIEDGLWDATKTAAAERGETVTDAVRRALEAYVGRCPTCGRGEATDAS